MQCHVVWHFLLRLRNIIISTMLTHPPLAKLLRQRKFENLFYNKIHGQDLRWFSD